MHNRNLIAVSLSLAGLISPLFAAASAGAARAPVEWRNLDNRVHPPGAFAGSMAYDETRSKMVLFGGSGETADPIGTWLNDGSGWQHAPVDSGPAERYGAMMAYHAASDRTILFGGYVYDEASGRNVAVDETWAWDGHSWTQLAPPTSPPARAFGSAAYDPVNEEIVLFGGVGRNASGGLEELGDTWTFDGSTWTHEETPTAPSARNSPGMAFHPGRGVVLFGGWRPGTGVPCTTTVAGICFKLDPSARGDDGIKADTWIWNDGWIQVPTAHSPPKRGGMGIAYDASSARTVVFGGVNIQGSFDDTWAFDGTDWVEISPTESPERRFDPVMAADPSRGLVLFGGHRVTYMGSDTWVFSGGKWTPADLPTPKPRFGHSLVYDDDRDRIVLFGGDADHVFSDTWIYRDAWERLSPQVSPPGRAQAGEAFDSARKELVVFGGQGSQGQDLGDAWTLEGTMWTEHAASPPRLSPLARRGPAMTYDPVRQETVMFGGWNADIGHLADTWIWDGAAWKPKLLLTSPPAVEDAAMTFDPVREQVVLFGGIDDANELRDETWLWNGDSWTQADPDTVPPGRSAATMTYVPELDAVAMMGGIGGDQGLWLWDGEDWEHFEVPGGPAKRSWSSMTYAENAGGAFLFGGVAQGYRSDTWLLSRPTPQPKTSVVDFTAATKASGQYSDATTFEVRLSDDGGSAIENQTVTFELSRSNHIYSATTNGDGIARVAPRLTDRPGSYQVTARFGGSDGYASAEAVKSFSITRKRSVLDLDFRSRRTVLVGRLRDSDGGRAGIAHRVVSFNADGKRIGRDFTDGGGRVRIGIPRRFRSGRHRFVARFGGDAYFQAVRASITRWRGTP